LKKDDIDLNSIVEEYKLSMGGSFFSKVQSDEDGNESEQILIDHAVENYLFDVGKLLLVYEKLSEEGKRELFYKVIISFINRK